MYRKNRLQTIFEQEYKKRKTIALVWLEIVLNGLPVNWLRLSSARCLSMAGTMSFSMGKCHYNFLKAYFLYNSC